MDKQKPTCCLTQLSFKNLQQKTTTTTHTHYHLTITKSKVREREGEELREDPERREIPVVALGSNQATRRRR
ncbi:unnamed protein product [Rhodiola kirilowii]